MIARIGASLFVLAGFCSMAQAGGTEKAKRAVQGWPEASKQVAEFMLDKYGVPDLVMADRLEWSGREKFKRIVVHGVAGKTYGVLEQTIRYEAPRDAIGLLAVKDCVVLPNRSEKELTAFCDREENVFLALNLADEVMTGKKGVAAARESFRRTVDERAAGKSSPAMEALSFKVKDPGNIVYSSELDSYIELD